MKKTKSKKSETPKAHKNYIRVNLGGWRKEEMRKLAKLNGVSLRDMVQHGLIEIRMQYRELLRLSWMTGLPPFYCRRFNEANANN